jgi:4-amino-4-deoxychorismate lyase
LSLLLETIKIEDGNIKNISYHQNRFDKSRRELFGSTHKINLLSLIKAPPKALFRCRILYDESVKSIEYIPYKEKKIEKLKIVHSNIEYNYKYANSCKIYRFRINRIPKGLGFSGRGFRKNHCRKD